MTDQFKEMWPIEKLSNWEKNPRSIDKRQFEDLKKHIVDLGQFKPLIVNTNPEVAPIGTIAGGNMRLRAMLDLGFTEAWITQRFFKDEKELIQVALADNQRSGYYDEDALAELIYNYKDGDWTAYNVDLGKTTDLTDLLANYGPDNAKDDAAPSVPKIPKSKPGDLYQLGKHRILCGDSTSQAAFDKLMDGKMAHMVLTDPPYGIDYMDNKGRKIMNDKMAVLG